MSNFYISKHLYVKWNDHFSQIHNWLEKHEREKKTQEKIVNFTYLHADNGIDKEKHRN